MKQYSPLAAQEDFLQILTAVHRLKETILVTPTDANDAEAAVIVPKGEWEALAELAFLQEPMVPKDGQSVSKDTKINLSNMEWG
ncbi:hypothetical protein FD13_GL001694 [Levilactobacillus senmaizukei DSM 21775 = NBRC 103853]|uniref:Antitoxin n=1 Tax=Levilactobacillus senmaizukei DSM 21775 = NBRC 103853 TaxID=1423803 RepID=A0A0R2DQR3_9LACO|nr:type II toxin-antitoxin system Phd/YefM family antitoxin [Levilactobacillus senmaizukei]KRN02700.1 hypothetical protein FD13_GL001694 [Levilactobacillus senmaizukei DSM 21775 = NBRC 103853]